MLNTSGVSLSHKTPKSQRSLNFNLGLNKPQQEGITTKPVYKELFILILQKTSNNN